MLQVSFEFRGSDRGVEAPLVNIFSAHVSADLTKAGAQILVINDDPLFHGLLHLTLERAGYRVVSATSPPEALAKLVESTMDLVLLDITASTIDSLAIGQQIRCHSGAPIILLTDPNRPEETTRYLELGVDETIAKPFTARYLAARIEAVLGRVELWGQDSRWSQQ